MRADLFQSGTFTLHSGQESAWKVEADSLTEGDLETLARLIVGAVGPFRAVYGVPRGGLRLALALAPTSRPWLPNLPVLVVDDILTTGSSMDEYRRLLETGGEPGPYLGVVLFARGPCPPWVRAVWTLGEWLR